MKSIRLILSILIVVVMSQLLAGCSELPSVNLEPDGQFIHFVDGYITKESKLVDLARNEIMNELWLHPGDVFIVNNVTDETAIFAFPEGMLTVVSEVEWTVDSETKRIEIKIPARHRAMLLVIKKVTDADAFFIGDSPMAPDGAPRVQIGDGP